MPVLFWSPLDKLHLADRSGWRKSNPWINSMSQQSRHLPTPQTLEATLNLSRLDALRPDAKCAPVPAHVVRHQWTTSTISELTSTK